MAVQKSRVRDSFAVSAEGFSWDFAALATLRHATLPWFDLPFGASFDAVALTELAQSGERERLSLLAQFAAHCAYLQFAGIADVEFDACEWVVVRRRGSDSRLLRIAAGTRAETESALASIEAFAKAIAAGPLPLLQRAWARPESLYRELFGTVAGDVAADLRWLRAAAAGVLLAPGVNGMRRVLSAEQGVFRVAKAQRALRTAAALEERMALVVVENTSPLVPFSALAAFGLDAGSDSVAAAAELLVAILSERRHVVLVADSDSIDAASQQVIEIARASVPAVWLTDTAGDELQEPEFFAIAPRLCDLRAVQQRAEGEADPERWLYDFVQAEDFGRFLAAGVIPLSPMRALAEPKRSWIAALALLGRRVERSLAARFLREFYFSGALEELAVEGVSAVDDEGLSFASEQARAAAAAHIPAASRAALCRAAARLTTGEQAALLYLEGGDPREAATILEASAPRSSAETVAVLGRFPREAITPLLRRRFAHALVDEGRYADALDVALLMDGDARELVFARAERRRGQYAAALARVESITERTAQSEVLRAELLRLSGRMDDAREATAFRAGEAEHRDRLRFERRIIDLETGIDGGDDPEDRYLRARLDSYRAQQGGDLRTAAERAAWAEFEASTPADRIDASLDRIFALFSSGEWNETRRAALEALAAIDETQGDRAAGAVVFMLAFLAADEGQWSHAESRLRRLREFYAGDDRGSAELELIEGHLAFARGRFDDAEPHARAVLAAAALGGQMREAAALILDEIDWIRGNDTPLRSTGTSGNAELDRRREVLLARRSETIDRTDELLAGAEGRAARLAVFRYAAAKGRDDVAASLARELGCDFTSDRRVEGVDARTLRAAALAPYPYAPTALPMAWRVASRNRMGRWSQAGSAPPLPAETLESVAAAPHSGWIRAGQELVFIEGLEQWPPESRNAIAAVFALRAENERLRRIVEQHEAASERREEDATIEGMIGSSPAIRAVQERIIRVAARDVVVLVLGESGTGKELAAHAVHRHSPRRNRTFTAINCAALPENLIESELFGHARGAFTGADRDRPGLIETTDGGTLFLDEIGEMPLPSQAKLLRFLQESEYRRVGETITRTADVRIVCATNRDLEQRVADGAFRQDLFYRIHGVDIVLPPLRERGSDILELAVKFLEHERAVNREGPMRLSPEVEEMFLAHRWPGNIRELQQVIRGSHAVAAKAEELRPEHITSNIPPAGGRRTVSGSYQDAVTRFRRELIERSLAEAGGNQNRAAAMLQISRQALGYQIRELGIMVRRARAR